MSRIIDDESNFFRSLRAFARRNSRMMLIPVLLITLWTPSISQEQRYVLSVDVELVNVMATVIDESGRYIDGLTAKDFQVHEDGQEQKISFFSHDTRAPISIGVLIDISGSLQDKLQQALQTVNEIAAALSPDDEMFIITFNSHVEMRQKFTSNTTEIQRSLRGLRAGGETAVYDAISMGVSEMQTAKQQKRILLLLTDGFDSKSKIKAAQAEDLIKRSGVLAYAIGIDDDDEPKNHKRARYHVYEYMLGRLTSAGGGRLIRLYSGRNHDLRGLAEMLVGELHQEYTMGYYPSTVAETSGLRSIEIRVSRIGARVFGERLHLVRRDPFQR